MTWPGMLPAAGRLRRSMNNDLISRSALLAEIKRIGGQPFSDWDTMGVLALAERIPAVDAVEVVRCKDCEKWKKKEETWLCWNFGYCSECMMDCHGDHFCSYGERRGEK